MQLLVKRLQATFLVQLTSTHTDQQNQLPATIVASCGRVLRFKEIVAYIP